MPATYSPLRYPGGKTKFYTYVKELLECNNLIGETYMEPFAGGAGLALKLLLKNDVSRIVKYSLQGTTQGRYLTGGVPPVRFSM